MENRIGTLLSFSHLYVYGVGEWGTHVGKGKGRPDGNFLYWAGRTFVSQQSAVSTVPGSMSGRDESSESSV
jgi:hypothetical protein